MSKITTIVDNIITKVNEHTSYISNLSTNKANIVDVNTANIILKTIATGTATFTATTNNITLTGIGIGVEIGDVIQISGAEDAKNNSEFTIEVITDANNIIVNQAHANKGTAKNVATRSSDTGVTVKLLAKWYNAPVGLGQGWVDIAASRASAVTYTNTSGKPIVVSLAATISGAPTITLSVRGVVVNSVYANASFQNYVELQAIITNNDTYVLSGGTVSQWSELR